MGKALFVHPGLRRWTGNSLMQTFIVARTLDARSEKELLASSTAGKEIYSIVSLAQPARPFFKIITLVYEVGIGLNVPIHILRLMNMRPGIFRQVRIVGVLVNTAEYSLKFFPIDLKCAHPCIALYISFA